MRLAAGKGHGYGMFPRFERFVNVLQQDASERPRSDAGSRGREKEVCAGRAAGASTDRVCSAEKYP